MCCRKKNKNSLMSIKIYEIKYKNKNHLQTILKLTTKQKYPLMSKRVILPTKKQKLFSLPNTSVRKSHFKKPVYQTRGSFSRQPQLLISCRSQLLYTAQLFTKHTLKQRSKSFHLSLTSHNNK